MRMWMVDPKTMCNRHLLGEHVECHMTVGTLRKKKSLQGYIDNDLLQPCTLVQRHNELAKEMEARGMNHQSPVEGREVSDMVYLLPDEIRHHRVDREKSLKDLHERCQECRDLHASLSIS